MPIVCVRQIFNYFNLSWKWDINTVMGHNKILTTVLAVVALVIFQGDQVSHAIDAYKPAEKHIHAAPASLPAFAKASFARSHFKAQGHPCEDLGHSEADCPLANIVDDYDITGISELPEQSQAPRLEAARNSVIPNEVDLSRQIRAPPVYPV